MIAFDDQAQTVQQFTTDTAALRNAIDAIKQTDRPSRLKLAYQLAQAQSAFIPEQLRPGEASLSDVWLYSDGRALDAKDVQLQGNLHYDKIGTDIAPNIAIVALSAKRNYQRPTEVQVFARLANFGPNPQKVQVQLTVSTIDDKGSVAQTAIKSLADVSLAPERWNDDEWVKDHPGVKDENFVAKDSVEFSLELTSAAVVTVEQMNKDGDQLAADDVAQVVVPPPKQLSVLLVTEGNWFLERALESAGVKNPQVMNAGIL